MLEKVKDVSCCLVSCYKTHVRTNATRESHENVVDKIESFSLKRVKIMTVASLLLLYKAGISLFTSQLKVWVEPVT